MALQEESKKIGAEVKVLEKDLSILNIYTTEAQNALKNVSRTDVTELKSFANPPDIVRRVLIVVALIMGYPGDWANARNVASVNPSSYLTCHF